MKIEPGTLKMKELADKGEYKIMPVSTELLSDFITPMEVLRKLKNVSKHCYMLESAGQDMRWGRYTFLGFDPKLSITCIDGELKVGDVKIKTTNPSEQIRQVLSEYKSVRFDNLPPFTGGLVGYFAFDYLGYSEPEAKRNPEDTEGFNDVDLMLFDKVIAFDNVCQKIVVIVNMMLKDGTAGYNKAVMELNNLVNIIKNGDKKIEKPGKIMGEVSPLFNKQEYCEMVKKAKRYIYEGDIFQIVLSNRIDAETEGSLFDTYRVLRRTNPSPYMFYFSSDDIEIAGASPETLVRLEGDKLNTFPLAGTRPRGATPEEDLALEKELLADEKERAEHNMLVDLGRNDIGKISKIGTVNVEKYMEIERFSHVMHIGSTVSGIIRDDRDALDAIDSILPAGTLSGAPKLRACELICELEENKRGIYGGAIGYIDFTGNLDTCIAIRLAFSKNGKVFVRSGAGIVADSVPKKEYEECLNKAKAVMNALKEAEGGLDK